MEFKSGLLSVDLDLSDNEDRTFKTATQAYELELQWQQRPIWHGEAMGQFSSFLFDLVCELQPTQHDFQVRVKFLEQLSSLIASMVDLTGATISTFGSFESNLYTRWADLDVSLELPESLFELQTIGKKFKVKLLRSLWKTLIRRAGAQNAEFIPRARVPLITFEDPYFNISCDISVDNGIAILKSRLLRWIGEIDPRCRNLIFLIKCWAKAHAINDPKTGTLNSFALCLLVVFHLQTRSPPVLPALHSVLDEDIARKLAEGGSTRILREQLLRHLWERIQPFSANNFGSQNKSSVAELFVSFFTQFSAVTNLWSQGLTVCTYTGKWGDQTSTCAQWRRKHYVMAVEDPFDRRENCARSVQLSNFKDIMHAFELAADILHRPPPSTGLPPVLEVLFCWSTDIPLQGMKFWLSKVYSQQGKKIFTPHARKPHSFADVLVAQFGQEFMISKGHKTFKRIDKVEKQGNISVVIDNPSKPTSEQTIKSEGAGNVEGSSKSRQPDLRWDFAGAGEPSPIQKRKEKEHMIASGKIMPNARIVPRQCTEAYALTKDTQIATEKASGSSLAAQSGASRKNMPLSSPQASTQKLSTYESREVMTSAQVVMEKHIDNCPALQDNEASVVDPHDETPGETPMVKGPRRKNRWRKYKAEKPSSLALPCQQSLYYQSERTDLGGKSKTGDQGPKEWKRTDGHISRTQAWAQKDPS